MNVKNMIWSIVKNARKPAGVVRRSARTWWRPVFFKRFHYSFSPGRFKKFRYVENLRSEEHLNMHKIKYIVQLIASALMEIKKQVIAVAAITCLY